MHQLPPRRTNLQVALDFGDSARLLHIGDEVAAHADWIEAGTPWLMSEGMGPVRALREMLPDKIIVADLKIVDAGEHEAEIGYTAGADIVTVLSMASDATISGAIRAAHAHGGKVLVDLLQEVNIADRFHEVLALGAHYICLHTAYDDLEAGLNPASDIAHFIDLAPQLAVVGGGIGTDNIEAIAKRHPCTIIVGRSVTEAPNPKNSVKALRAILDNLRMDASTR